jgi:aspartyl-tRNA synthetase
MDEQTFIDCAEHHIGEIVTVSGIVKKIRNHGGLIFIDVYNRINLIQALVIPDNVQAYAMSKRITKGFLVEIKGRLKECPISNQNIKTLHNKIEIEVESLAILSARDEQSNLSKATDEKPGINIIKEGKHI